MHRRLCVAGASFLNSQREGFYSVTKAVRMNTSQHIQCMSWAAGQPEGVPREEEGFEGTDACAAVRDVGESHECVHVCVQHAARPVDDEMLEAATLMPPDIVCDPTAAQSEPIVGTDACPAVHEGGSPSP
eukprot:comp16481_c0_seq1/m.14453 comp16481_c0_seq1/g.14453  ORF comp16481_c0_seq1/g.14453 comp16481_c0_seq1/m.14453 type:complete len:130 (-) comp16481_c0_seq1:317-706(-)